MQVERLAKSEARVAGAADTKAVARVAAQSREDWIEGMVRGILSDQQSKFKERLF